MLTAASTLIALAALAAGAVVGTSGPEATTPAERSAVTDHRSSHRGDVCHRHGGMAGMHERMTSDHHDMAGMHERMMGGPGAATMNGDSAGSNQ